MRRASLLIAAALACATAHASEVDPDAARSMLKKSDCFKCHAMDKKKDGPPYKEIAGKYRGKAEAEGKLYTHVTTNPMVEIDGKKEEHKSLKTADETVIRNVIRYILSLS